jgi:hypothetical protein
VSAEDTEPVVVRGALSDQAAFWQKASQEIWSFGSRSRNLFSPPNLGSAPVETPFGQTGAKGTVGPQRVKVPEVGPLAAPARRFGQKAWQPLAHWEGVVEEVDGDTIRVRLTPLIHGRPDFTRVEFVEFSFDELAYPADRELVTRDAKLYWTVGRRKDEAGTVSNDSLVRVRRQVPPSIERQRRGAEEAAAFLAEAREQE